MLTNINGWVDVKDYGAVGNGVNDDTVPVTSAITSLPAAGGVVYFPPGTFVVREVVVPSNITIQGCGTQASVLLSTVANTAILTVPNGASAVSIANIGLTYSASLEPASGGDAIHLQSTTGVHIRDVAIINPYIGVHVDGKNDSCKSTRIDSVTVTCNAGAFAGVSVSGGGLGCVSINTLMTDCVVRSTASTAPSYGFDLENAQSTEMLNCLSVGVQTGLNICPRGTEEAPALSYHVFATNCAFQESTSYGGYLGVTSAKDQVYDVNIVGCTFSDSGETGVWISGSASQLLQTSGVRLSGCSIRGSGIQAVQMTDVDHSNVTACGIYGNSTDTSVYYVAVVLDSVQDSLVACNIITGAGGGYTVVKQAAGVDVDSACSNIGVFGNDLAGNYAGGLVWGSGQGSVFLAAGNLAYNPQGLVSPQPAMISSGVANALVNPYPSPAQIYLKGTGITAVGIVKKTVATTFTTVPPQGSPIRLGAGESIYLTYTGSPTWQWFIE
jgi:hypothetical protein